jgi:hypothetical protein
MANCYFEIIATETIPCSDERFAQLAEALLIHSPDEDGFTHEMTVTRSDGQLHMYSTEGGEIDLLPQQAIEVIVMILKEANLDFWEFGYCYYCDKPRPGSAGGGIRRILKNGKIE